ncbi:MAG: hypothetical protein SVS85_00505 [Candidatus Nanohaloarchaea archaeon]|nr:hypothetical protein [Candidatus Nanohaloarchaea archaeon]
MVEAVTVSLGISVVSLVAVTLTYYRLGKRVKHLEEEKDRLDEKLSRVSLTEEKVLGDTGEIEMLERNIEDIAERLFQVVKKKYSLEDVTTYEEMIEELEGLDVDDVETRDLILDLFRELVKIQYSEEELPEKNRAYIKQTAYRLIKRAGPRLENPPGSK